MPERVEPATGAHRQPELLARRFEFLNLMRVRCFIDIVMNAGFLHHLERRVDIQHPICLGMPNVVGLYAKQKLRRHDSLPNYSSTIVGPSSTTYQVVSSSSSISYRNTTHSAGLSNTVNG